MPKKSKRDPGLQAARRALREHALGLPGAVEEFPWGESVGKVNKKVFVFLGLEPVADGPMSLSVKLPQSAESALDLPFTRPTGYGLGKSGWITATFEAGQSPPVAILKGWILESYCAVAPRKIAAELEKTQPEFLAPVPTRRKRPKKQVE